jgi:hypothetical protein
MYEKILGNGPVSVTHGVLNCTITGTENFLLRAILLSQKKPYYLLYVAG